MSKSVLKEKSKEFAKNIVLLCRKMRNSRVESELVKQLLKSGTSIGANIHEAQYAQGTKDFISKLEIALKECNESSFWLDLLYDIESISKEDYAVFNNNCIDLRRMLVSSIKTLKDKKQ